MPVLSTVGAASLRAFGAFRQGTVAANFISATGGTVYVDPTNADYKIHQFTSNGTFAISAAPASPSVEVMMVGGGGSGLYGGGGAGGYVYRSSFTVSVGSFNVVIGAGGGGSGGDTTFSGLVALGGGGGAGSNGGSGGGGVDGNGGAGLQPTSATGGFGNKGGDWTSFGYDGGGGGAGSAGGMPFAGSGRTADIISSSGTYATFATGGTGNLNSVSTAFPAVVANSGNGGWGGGYDDSNGNPVSFGSGQAGIVRIRYKFQ
jgi:hypothetical protein